MFRASSLAQVGLFGCPASAREAAIRHNVWVLTTLPIEEWATNLRPVCTPERSNHE